MREEQIYLFKCRKSCHLRAGRRAEGKGNEDKERKGEARGKLKKCWLACSSRRCHGNPLCFQILTINSILLNFKILYGFPISLSPFFVFFLHIENISGDTLSLHVVYIEKTVTLDTHTHTHTHTLSQSSVTECVVGVQQD